MKIMNALYPGKCATCGGAIKRYRQIAWDARNRKAHHYTCWRAAEDEAAADAEAERAYERRAAFGPGVTVVNILTGEKYRT